MDRMVIILIDPILQRYIAASRRSRTETPNEILRRLLKLDEVPRREFALADELPLKKRARR